MNAIGDNAKTITLLCNQVNKVTKYVGTVISPQAVGGPGYTQAFVPGVYRYVFNLSSASGGGLGGVSVNFTGLPTNCSINVYQINSGLPGFTSTGTAAFNPQTSTQAPVYYTGPTSIEIPITINASGAGVIYFKVVVEIHEESQ